MTSAELTVEDLKKAVNLAEEKFCPVWAMITTEGKIDDGSIAVESTLIAGDCCKAACQYPYRTE